MSTIDLSMKGSGFYNKNSSLQRAGIETVVNHFERIFKEHFSKENNKNLMVIADYGSSQGYNSSLAINNIIQQINQNNEKEETKKKEIEFLVFHEDLPTNDWNAVFGITSDSYKQHKNKVHVSGIGKSFYQQVLPNNFVSVGFSSYAVHWLSKIPVQEKHCYSTQSVDMNPKVAEAYKKQSDEDWKVFLETRTKELCPGALFLLLAIENHPDKKKLTSGPIIFACLKEMINEGLLKEEVLSNFVIPIRSRTKEEFLDKNCLPSNLEIVEYQSLEAPSPVYEEYKEHKDVKRFGAELADALRAPLENSVLSSFKKAGLNEEEAEKKCSILFERMALKFSEEPEKYQANFAPIAFIIFRKRQRKIALGGI